MSGVIRVTKEIIRNSVLGEKTRGIMSNPGATPRRHKLRRRKLIRIDPDEWDDLWIQMERLEEKVEQMETVLKYKGLYVVIGN